MREQLIVADAFLVAAVEILVSWHAKFVGAANDRFHQFAFADDVGRPQRSLVAVLCVCAAAIVLGLDEIGQNALPVPPSVAELRPAVVILAQPANADQS